MEEVFGGFSLALSPLVQIWLEEALVELGHASEGCPSVEEVEFFVVLFVLLLAISDVLFT